MQKSENKSGKLAIITGASSGIGEAVARKLAEEGIRVVLVARREQLLKRIVSEINQNGGKAHAITADLLDEDERVRINREILVDYGPVDILINNAGFSYYGFFSDMAWETAEALIKINALAVVHLSTLFLPSMLEKHAGHIINMGSIVGQFPNQGTAVYAGTKAFLDAFTTAFYRENIRSGVVMSVIRPGPVRTELFDVAEHIPGSRRLPAEKAAIDADMVAEKVWKIIQKPRRVAYVPGITGLSPWIELIFGKVIDRLGPLLLRKE